MIQDVLALIGVATLLYGVYRLYVWLWRRKMKWRKPSPPKPLTRMKSELWGAVNDMSTRPLPDPGRQS